MEQAFLYGFGSFFRKKGIFNDVDLLIIHNNTSYSSCQFALSCKKQLLSIICNADITILSQSGERQLEFLKKSNALYLGNVNESSLFRDIDCILSQKLFEADKCLKDIIG